MVLAVSSGFVLLPLLWVGSFLSIADNALNYSMNQSAKESLYVPTSPVEKYQAKAFIDVFVQRSGQGDGRWCSSWCSTAWSRRTTRSCASSAWSWWRSP